MTIVAVTHGYVRTHAMGGEVALHRTLSALPGDRLVLTRTPDPYEIDGIRVAPIGMTDVLNPHADPTPLVWQLAKADAHLVIAQNEIALPAVKAAHTLGVPAIVNVHAPTRYGKGIAEAVRAADGAIFNTTVSAREWGHRRGIVVHPPTSAPPTKPGPPEGTAYTMLSNLANKGAAVVLDLAQQMPDRQFLMVRSPAEPTHGLPDFDARAAQLANVEVGERCPPEQVAATYLSRTRILLVPSRMETYGMSAIEAAGYGIPTVGIMNAHIQEGIGDASYGTAGLDREGTRTGITVIEADYTTWSARARERALFLASRQKQELEALAAWVAAF